MVFFLVLCVLSVIMTVITDDECFVAISQLSLLAALVCWFPVMFVTKRVSIEKYPATVIVADKDTFILKCGSDVETSHDIRFSGKSEVNKVWVHEYNGFDKEFSYKTYYDCCENK